MLSLLLTAWLVLHEWDRCATMLDVSIDKSSKSQVLEAHSLCPSASGADLDPEDGLIILVAGHYRVYIPLPSPKWAGWVRYTWGQGYAYLFGNYPVPVRIELLEEV